MKQTNQIQLKSYAFAVNVIKLCRKIIAEQREYDLGRQLLRSGTSIGANVEEAIGAHSEKDFIARMTIVYKESRETNYWLRLLRDTQIIDQHIAKNFMTDCEEIIKITTAILKTMKQKNQNPPIINS